MPIIDFQVRAQAQFEPDQSLPQQGLFRFSYTITITNTGQVTAQLIARHWLIQDALGEQQEVHGLGVVGRQPLLQPGESFTYDSACELRTASGTMQGRYLCVTEDGETFDCDIPLFVLDMDADSAAALPLNTSRTLH